MKKNINIDTSKIKTEIVRDLNTINENIDRIITYINKINDLKCMELVSEMEYLKKDMIKKKNMCNSYLKSFNSIAKDFDNLSLNIINKTKSIEKVNANSLISNK